VARLGFDGDELAEIVESLGDDLSGVRLYLGLLRRYAAARKEAQWIGDKDPRSVEFLRLLSRCFPAAHVLHVIRDPRDVLASKKKAAWSRNRSVLRHVFANRVQLKMGRLEGRALFGDRYLELAYEDLITDPRGVLGGVCRHLGVDFDPAMLDFSTSSRQLVSQEEMQWKKETLGPLLTTNAGKWKQQLTPWETALTERVCRDAFETCPHEMSDCRSRLSPFGRLALGPVALTLRVLDPVYRCYRWGQTR